MAKQRHRSPRGRGATAGIHSAGGRERPRARGRPPATGPPELGAAGGPQKTRGGSAWDAARASRWPKPTRGFPAPPRPASPVSRNRPRVLRPSRLPPDLPPAASARIPRGPPTRPAPVTAAEPRPPLASIGLPPRGLPALSPRPPAQLAASLGLAAGAAIAAAPPARAPASPPVCSPRGPPPPASLPLGPTPRARNHSAGRRREPPARGRSQGTGERAWVPPGSRGGPNPSKPRGGARPWPTPRDRPAAGGPHGAARKPHGAWTCETHGRTTTQDPGHVAPRERPGPGKNEEPGPATQKPTRPRRGPNSAAGAQDTLERTEAQDPGPQRASRRIAGRIPWTRTRDRLFTKRFWVHRKTKKTQRFSPKRTFSKQTRKV